MLSINQALTFCMLFNIYIKLLGKVSGGSELKLLMCWQYSTLPVTPSQIGNAVAVLSQCLGGYVSLDRREPA